MKLSRFKKNLSLGLLLLGSLSASAKVIILEANTEVFEIPRSQMKTYIQNGTLEQNLKPVKALKPGAVSDEELLAIPEKYLPPELQQKQKQLREQRKANKLAKKRRSSLDSYTPGRESEVVKIRRGKDKVMNLKIDQAIWVPPSAGKAASILAPQRKLPDIELIEEIKIETSGKVKKEIKPGEPREISELFQNGKTRDVFKTALLPAYFFYEAKDYATSTTLSLDILSDSKNAETKLTARYLLAHSLYQAGFYASALSQLVELSTTKWRRSAIGMAASALEKTRDDGAANQILSKLSLSQVPKEHQPLFSFHLGRILLNTGARGAALAAFKRVPSDHKRYPEAQYYMGVIRTAELSGNVSADDWDKENSLTNRARTHFEEALTAARAMDAADLISLIHVSLARLAYQSKQYNQSIFFYNEVDPSSPFVRESSYESAWSLYRIGEFNRSLGLLHPLGSNYYESKDLPEIWILRSLSYLKLCRFDESKRAANQFEATLHEVEPQIKTDLSQLKNLKISAPSALKTVSLTDWVKNILLSDPVVQKDMTRENLLSQEKSRLGALRKNPRITDSELKNSAAQILESAIDRKISAVSTALKPYLISRLSDALEEYKTQKGRLDFLRFEIYNQATKFPKALERPEAQKLIAKKEFLPGVFLKGREVLWKFSGEYWEDELRGYDYFIPTECNSSDL